MNFRIRITALIIIIGTMSGCKKADDSFVSTVSARTILDVAYGVDAKQTMDIYLPANRRADSTKIMVMIHGGGWTTGDKSDFNT